jgi:hypothetical protein
MRSLAFSCLLPVVGVGITAKSTLVFGPGGLPEISSALAVAAPGDIIHVLPGTYAPFAVGIGCTIRGTVPGGVHVTDPAGTTSVTITSPPGQVVHLVALDFSFPVWGGVAINGGRVTLDQCTLLSAGAVASATSPFVITNADVHLQRCNVSCSHPLGFGAAMGATNSRITAIDSQFFGSPLVPSFFYSTSAAVYATGTTLHAAGCAFHAGTFGIGRAGLQAIGGQVWLSDCTVVGYGYCPIDATSVLADRCSLQPVYPGCSTPPGGGLLGVSRLQPMQNGAAFTLVYSTIPNSYVAIFASQELATLMIPGLHAQNQWLGGAGVVNLGVAFADGAGQANATWNLPAAPWLVDQPLWFQGLTGFAFPLQLSPVAGGLIR